MSQKGGVFRRETFEAHANKQKVKGHRTAPAGRPVNQISPTKPTE